MNRDDDDNGFIGCYCGAESASPAAYVQMDAEQRDAFWRRAEACEGCGPGGVAVSVRGVSVATLLDAIARTR